MNPYNLATVLMVTWICLVTWVAIYVDTAFDIQEKKETDYYVCEFHWEWIKVYDWDHDISVYSWLIYDYSPEHWNVVSGSWNFASNNIHCMNVNMPDYEKIARKYRCQNIQWGEEWCRRFSQ